MRFGLMVTQAVLQNALGNHNRAYPESIELVCTKVNPCHPREGEAPLASSFITPAPTTRHPRPFDRLRAGSGGDLPAFC